jgi:hypothetical protein
LRNKKDLLKGDASMKIEISTTKRVMVKKWASLEVENGAAKSNPMKILNLVIQHTEEAANLMVKLK